MTRRDAALLIFRAVALWFGIYAIGLFAVAVSVWHQDGASTGIASIGVAALFMFGAIAAWTLSPWMATRVFPAREEPTLGLTREDLWSTVILGIGAFLLAKALPRLAYWIMIHRLPDLQEEEARLL